MQLILLINRAYRTNEHHPFVVFTNWANEKHGRFTYNQDDFHHQIEVVHFVHEHGYNVKKGMLILLNERLARSYHVDALRFAPVPEDVSNKKLMLLWDNYYMNVECDISRLEYYYQKAGVSYPLQDNLSEEE